MECNVWSARTIGNTVVNVGRRALHSAAPGQRPALYPSTLGTPRRPAHGWTSFVLWGAPPLPLRLNTAVAVTADTPRGSSADGHDASRQGRLISLYPDK